MNERSLEIYAYIHAMIGAYSAMSDEERLELKAWEKENLDGRSTGTSDWPGWEKYIGKKPKPVPKCKDRSGFVYIIRSGGSNRYKIGVSKNVNVRLGTLQTGNPEELFIVAQFSVLDAIAIEQELHMHFESNRVNREWFELNEDRLKELLLKVSPER